MNKTKIEWCDSTVNPVVGCTFGCPFCYAKRLNDRFGWIKDFSKPQFFLERLKQLESKKPKVIFMDSMSDIADWEPEWMRLTFSAILKNPQHTYLFLTKRMELLINDALNPYSFIDLADGESNVWIGSSITTCKDVIDRDFYENDFISIEPLLEDISPVLYRMSFVPKWVIIGAETGNRKEKVVPKREWIERIVKKCDKHEVPVFMKDSLISVVGEENMRREFPWGIHK